VQKESSLQIQRRLDALVEDADLRAVADADDVTVDQHLVARAELADRSSSSGTDQSFALELPVVLDCPSASTCAVARRAAQHW
jgi:hypothetical protein